MVIAIVSMLQKIAGYLVVTASLYLVKIGWTPFVTAANLSFERWERNIGKPLVYIW